MATTLKQFQGSLVDPKDDAKVYQFLGGASGVVVGCVATLYATNQLKISDGWGFACGRVFTVDEEIVVANTAAAKGRIIVNIDLENIAKPACLATQSAAVLPALVQEDINADGTVFQLALAQYDIASNTISNLTDVRVMLYDIDSRINAKVDLGETSSTAYRGDRGKTAYDHSQATGNPHSTTKANIGLGNVDNTSDANKPVSIATQTALNAKQDKITNTANQLFYGSGTAGSLNQLTSPSTSGSMLRQDTTGAPYWHQTRTVLYNTSGTNSNFTLSYTAADYNMIRIYFAYDDLVAYSSVDVYSPNGKTASLSFVAGDANNLYYKFATVAISGTSITWGANGHAWAPNGGAVGINATSKPIKILRVEGFKY